MILWVDDCGLVVRLHDKGLVHLGFAANMEVAPKLRIAICPDIPADRNILLHGQITAEYWQFCVWVDKLLY